MEHMFAVVLIAGKQYSVKAGDTIEVEKLVGKEGSTITFDSVLLVGDNGKTKIGTPLVKGASVKAKVLAQKKGEKIEVSRYKSKVRYRKHIGFRPLITQLEILAIE